MASTEKKFLYIQEIRPLNQPGLPSVPEESKFYSLWQFLQKATFGIGQLKIQKLQEEWGLKIDRRKKKEVEIFLFGFPDFSEKSAILGFFPPLAKEKVENLSEKHPQVHSDFWEYYQYFGDVLPVHLLPAQILLFGFESHFFPLPQGDVEKCREWINQKYWAAEDEEFPGRPVLLLGKDENENLWFATEDRNEIWCYDVEIQGVRNANYYDDDEDTVEWQDFARRILESWTKTIPNYEEKNE